MASPTWWSPDFLILLFITSYRREYKEENLGRWKRALVMVVNLVTTLVIDFFSDFKNLTIASPKKPYSFICKVKQK